MSANDDMLLGHMTVLMQYDWPKYQTQFCDLIRTIAERRKFTYNLFFTYVVSILLFRHSVLFRHPLPSSRQHVGVY